MSGPESAIANYRFDLHSLRPAPDHPVQEYFKANKQRTAQILTGPKRETWFSAECFVALTGAGGTDALRTSLRYRPRRGTRKLVISCVGSRLRRVLTCRSGTCPTKSFKAEYRLTSCERNLCGLWGENEQMPRVLVNIQSSQYWSVHFIGPDNKTRIGPWLLFDNHEQARAILHWGRISANDMAEHDSSIRRWSTSSVGLEITERQLAQLIERGKVHIRSFCSFLVARTLANTCLLTTQRCCRQVRFCSCHALFGECDSQGTQRLDHAGLANRLVLFALRRCREPSKMDHL
jgi:hypothetical protein